MKFGKILNGYEYCYQVSNFGRVRSLIDNKGRLRDILRILKPYLDDDGYEIIRLFKNGKAKAFKVHRLVAINFLSNNENKLQVDHIDTNRRNNNYTNLRWVTSKENSNNPNTINNLKKVGIKYKTMYGKPIIDKKGNIYPSIIEASRQLGISRSSIQNKLKIKSEEFNYV